MQFTSARGRTLEIREGMDLDAMSAEDLMTFWSVVRRNPVKVARVLFPARPKGYVTATRNLANYAANKATAISCRERGDIKAARVYDLCCDFVFSMLPYYAHHMCCHIMYDDMPDYA